MCSLRNLLAKGCFGLKCSEDCKLTRVFLVLLALWVLASPAYAKYGGGSGTAEDPYRISTAADMNAIGTDSNDWDKYFVVTDDIDMSSIPGTSYNLIYPFTGVFDGNNHTISNFSFVPTSGGAGLFGRVDGGVNSGIIKDVGLIDPNVDGGISANIGALVGNLRYGAIVTNCYVQGGSVNGGFSIGGLVGRIYPTGGTISNCYATCNVTCYSFCAGGLLGRIEAGTVTNCYATGSVTATGDPAGIAGGLVGGNYGGMIENSYATGNVIEEGGGSMGGSTGGLLGLSDDYYGVSIVNNCYATGNVSGTTAVGGLVGFNTGTITNSYSTGSVSGTSDVGGLVGDDDTAGGETGTATNSFWDKQTSGKDTSAGGTGKTTAEMKKESTFTNWDFVEIWNIGEEQTYAFLRVYPAGDIDHSDSVNWDDLASMVSNWLEGILN